MGGVYNFWNVLGWRLSFRFWRLLLLLPSSSELLLSSCRWKNVIPRILYWQVQIPKGKIQNSFGNLMSRAAETAPYSLSTNHPPVVLFAGSAVRCCCIQRGTADRREYTIAYLQFFFQSFLSFFFTLASQTTNNETWVTMKDRREDVSVIQVYACAYMPYTTISFSFAWEIENFFLKQEKQQVEIL